MGDAVSSATNATVGAVKRTYNVADSLVTGAGRVGRAVYKDPNLLAGVLVNPLMVGSSIAATTATTSAVEQVMAANEDPPPEPPSPGAQPQPILDPQQKRRRQIAGRAGTFLTGPSGIGSSPSTGTNLGGAGGRSTLLGL